jgi:hypothetical protein
MAEISREIKPQPTFDFVFTKCGELGTFDHTKIQPYKSAATYTLSGGHA